MLRASLVILFLVWFTAGFAQPQSDEGLTSHPEVKKMLLDARNRKYEIIISERIALGHFSGLVDECKHSYAYINDSVIKKQNLHSLVEVYFVHAADSFFAFDIRAARRKPAEYITIEKDSAGYIYRFEYAVTGEEPRLVSFEKEKRDSAGRIIGFYEWDKWGLMSDLTFTFAYSGDTIIEKGYRFISPDSLIPYRDIISVRRISKDKSTHTLTSTITIYDPDRLANGEAPRTETTTITRFDKEGRFVLKERYGQYSSPGNPDLVVKAEYRKMKKHKGRK